MPEIFVKLVFKITAAQQTRTRYQTFEEVVDRPPAPEPTVQPAATPIFGPFLAQLC